MKNKNDFKKSEVASKLQTTSVALSESQVEWLTTNKINVSKLVRFLLEEFILKSKQNKGDAA